ncbi:TatD family hydrolase [Treponema sp. C6A8]|uniref:TatD family hydrolase n=1 Tax=Treponema sp. C6A8 TaxID=1410609 RepID=UPI00068448DB|nr:TatD family hydrolase [Treponema sp. C6A8]
MLEKFEKKFCDAHFHYAVCRDFQPDLKVDWNALSCAHSFEEWEIQKKAPACVKKAFGLHPQACLQPDFDIKKYADFLEGLLKAGKNTIHAIGEAGFDYFTPAFREKALLQEEMWNIQLELALQYKMPLVVHCRKANEKLFEYAARLKKLPAVLFHSFMGSFVEAESLIRRGIPSFFSFGKQMKNGNKKVIECVKKLPLENLLLETDAPFQTLKGEAFTRAGEIRLIYEAAAEIRGFKEEYLVQNLQQNFIKFLNF